jgi:hypothetical protein
MTDKALISAYTYHTLEDQRTNSGGMPVFILPDDLPQLFRSTTRKVNDIFHVESLGIIAEKEDKFREFIAHAKKRHAEIVSREDNQTFIVNGNCENLVKWWKDSRRKGSSKIGGDRGGAKKRAAIAERAKGLTRAEWTDGAIKNPQLVKKYGASLNALKRYASDKGWGHDRQKAIWRSEQRRKK